MTYRTVFTSTLVAFGVAATLAAQGQPPAPTRSLWDGVYTREQAQYGAFLYANNCESCHKADMSGRADANGDAAPLAGAEFWRNHVGKTLERTFTIMRTQMPATAPGSLRDSDYAALLAYILEANEFPAGTVELPADTKVLAELKFEDRPAR